MNEPNLVQDLGASQVVRIVERRFPELAPVRASYLGAGMDSVAFEVNGTWVFRFPLRASVEAQLFVERAMLPVLGPLLPITIPRFEFAGRPDHDFPLHFAGYAKLPGVSATEVEPQRTDFPAIGRQLGPFLTAIHRYPVADAEKMGTGTHRMEQDYEDVRASALELIEPVASCLGGLAASRLRARLLAAEPVPAPPWPVTLCHYDLAAEHVLLDETGARVTGVIDWGDISIGDPTVDFVGLYAWGGEAFVRAVLDNYEGVVDERVLDRVRPWATFRSVQDIEFGMANDQRAVVELAVRALEREMK
jgi:aminoglycoside phosphotransferase (APT) family kinase protein